MSDRLCGYCRQLNHTKNKCPVRIEQIDIIRRSVGQQRKLAQQILLANGIGPGAIIGVTDSWTGEKIPCIVSALETYDLGIEYRNIKYKKQVRVSLSFLGDTMPDTKHEFVRWMPKSKIGLTVFSLADPSKDMFAYFTLDSLENPIVDFKRGVYRGWDYNNPSTILSKSDETEVNMAHILRPFQLHERLTLDKTSSNTVTPIV